MHRALKPVTFALLLLPLAWLVWLGLSGGLGANPIEAVVRFLGDWAIRVLLLALAVTPVRRLTGWSELARLRRMVGLFAFFYVSLHLAAYVGLEQFFDWQAIWKDVVKRKFITAGMLAFLLLLPLALTSTAAMIRRLGGARWRALHKLVFPAGVLAVLHHFWLVKADVTEPVIHGLILAGLIAVRLISRPRAALHKVFAALQRQS